MGLDGVFESDFRTLKLSNFAGSTLVLLNEFSSLLVVVLILLVKFGLVALLHSLKSFDLLAQLLVECFTLLGKK